MKIMKKRKLFAIICSVCALTCAVFGFSACKSSLTVEEKTKTSLVYEHLSQTSLTLRIGETKTLTASTEISSWTSDDTKVAIVQNGVVTSVAEGVTFVRATTATGETLCCLINVTNVAFAPQIDLNFSSRTMNVGDEWELIATVKMDGVALEQTVTWSNTDDAVVTIQPKGNAVTVKGVASGATTVYATVGNSTVSCAFTVNANENLKGSFEGCEEMKKAVLTQLDFGCGVSVNDDYNTTENVSVYQRVYYGEYENNADVKGNSLVAYATLASEANKPISLEYEGYYTYGIIVSVSQSHNETMGAYAEKTYRFYASENANEDGQYGVFIQDVPQGHYLVRAFIEYELDGEIVTETSENESAAGELRYEILGGAKDLILMVNDSKCMSFGTTYGAEDTDEIITDANNVTIKAAYAATIPDTMYYQHYNAPKFRFHTGLTREMIRALIAEGYATLSVYTMFKTAETEYLGVNVLDKTADFSSATLTDGPSSVNKRLVSSVSDGTSNVWYYVEYELSFLFENYELLFADKTNYPFMDMDRLPMTGGTFYLSAFTVNRSEALIREEVSVTLNDMRVNGEIAVAKKGDTVTMSDGADGYIYTVNGQSFAGEYMLAEEGVYLFTAQPKGENAVARYQIIVGDGTSVSKLFDMSELAVGTSDNQIYYHTPGVVTKDATYNGMQEVALKQFNSETVQDAKTVAAWSYSGKYAHYMGPQVHLTSAVTKAELQALAVAGYKTVSFQYTATEGVEDNKTGSDYYVLDFAKIKAMIEESESMDAARATVEKSFTAWANTAHDDFMTKKYDYRCKWKTITYNVEDLIACYEVLDLLPIVFDSFVCSNTTEPFWNLYITGFTFTKE